MKIFKSKIVAVVATLAMVISSIAVPVFADQTATADQTTTAATTVTSAPATVTQPATTADAASFLQGKGLLQGDDNGNLMLDQNLTREQMVVILSRLMGQEDQAKTYTTDYMPFTDVPLDSEYAPYIAWAYDNMITQGTSDTTFGFGQSLTTEQTKLFFVRALGYVDLTDEEQLAKADELNLAAGSTAVETAPIVRADMALLMSNTLFAKDSNGDVFGTTVPAPDGSGNVLPSEPAQPPVDNSALEVTGATMLSDSAIKVTFNRAVADTSVITFSVTGASTITPTATWSDDKTTATLTNGSVILQGAYTITVAGDSTLDATKNTASLVVVKNGIAKIQITDTTIAENFSDPTHKADFHFKLFDNYGNDITQTYSSDLTIVSSAGNGTVTDVQNGVATITKSSGVWDTITTTNPQTIAVTLVSKTTGISANASLTLADVTKVDSLTLGAITYPVTTPATTSIVNNVSLAAYIAVDAKDQYGNEVTDTNRLTNEVMYIVSDTNVHITPSNTTDADGNTLARLNLDTTGVSAAETVTLTAVSKSSGKSSQISLNIQKASQPDKISLLSTKNLVAAGDDTDTLVIPMVVTDQYGKQLSASDLVSDASGFTFSGDFQGTDGLDATKTKLKIETSGPNAGCIVNAAPVVNSSKGTKVLTVNYTGATSIGTETISISDPAYPRTIKVANTPATTLLQGSTGKIYYSFVDQYGRDMSSYALANFSANCTAGGTTVATNGYNVKFTLSGTDYLTFTGGGINLHTGATSDYMTPALAGDSDNMLQVGVVGTSAGNGSIKAELLDETGATTVSTVQTAFNTVMGAPTSLTYSIDDVPTLAAVYSTAPVFTGASENAQYVAVLNVTAKDSSGTVYAIPSNRILSVTSSDPSIVVAQLAAPHASVIKNQQDAPVVYGLSTAFDSTDAVGSTKSATVTILVSNDAGVQNITKTITITKEASTTPPAKSVVFEDTALDVTNPYVIPSTAKAVTDLVGSAAQIATQSVYVYTLDNYGVYTQVASPVFTIANPDKFTNGVTYSGNAIHFNDAQAQINQDVYFMYQSGTAYNQIRMRDTSGVATLDTTAPAAPIVTSPAVINLANLTAYSVSGTAEAGATVTVTLTDAASTAHVVTGSATAAAVGGAYTVTVDASTLTDGAVSVSATAKDAAANVSTATAAATTKDVVAPAVPTVNAVASTDTTVTGTAEVGSTVTVKVGTTTLATATADGSGNYSVTIAAQATDTVLAVTATDAAGNTSTAANVTVS